MRKYFNFHPDLIKPFNDESGSMPNQETSNCSSAFEITEIENKKRSKIPDFDFSKRNYSCFSARNMPTDRSEYYRCANQKSVITNRKVPSQSRPTSWLYPISTAK